MLAGGAGQRTIVAFLLADVPAQHVGGDAEQPGAHLRARGLIGGALPEGDQEGLGEQVVRGRSDPAGQIAVDGHRVPVEERRELFRLPHRFPDQHVVGDVRRLRA